MAQTESRAHVLRIDAPNNTIVIESHCAIAFTELHGTQRGRTIPRLHSPPALAAPA
jgi:hypothetical protein